MNKVKRENKLVSRFVDHHGNVKEHLHAKRKKKIQSRTK